jgi:hypothetical protein
MLKLPNNDAARAIHRVGQDVVASGSEAGDNEANLDQASDTLSEDRVGLYKESIRSAQDDCDGYLRRNQLGLGWLYSQWPGQWSDGRKWPLPGETKTEIWPWPGASDSRDRTCQMVVDEEVLVGMFALQNMKVQARSSRPIAMIRESQQVTTLLNWQLFVQLKAELHREMYFALNWRTIFGCVLLDVGWRQERRIDQVPLNRVGLAAVLQANGGSGRMDEVAAMIADPTYEDDLVRIVQSLSPLVTRAEARRAVRDLRQVGFSTLPVPYVFKSEPEITALRAGVDIIFPGETCDLRFARLLDRVERVPEAVLLDRIATAGYDPEFVDRALEHKGELWNESWARQTAATRGSYYVNSNNSGGVSGFRDAWARYGGGSPGGADDDALVELHHVTRLQHDRGVPVLMETVLHMGVEIAGSHGPARYPHGEVCSHVMRRDHRQRPILSSEGLPEICYSFEQLLKAQADAQIDRSDLALRPPMITDSYEEMQKFKALFMPTAVVPVRRHGSFDWFKPPQYDIGSVQIMQQVMAKIDRYFGLFGPEVDPDKKQLRRRQLGSDLMTELHPVLMQVLKLDQWYLPDAEVSMIVGTLARPFHISRREIQGAWQIAATVDMNMIDADFLKNALQYGVQLASLDTMGIGDRAYLLQALAEMISPDFAENFIKHPQAATQQEQQDEQKAVDLILASGMDQPFPKGANYQLRAQVLQSRVQQALQSNPVVQRRVRENPEIMQVLKSRLDGFNNQVQQQQNAQIGRDLTMQTFAKQALPQEAGQ